MEKKQMKLEDFAQQVRSERPAANLNTRISRVRDARIRARRLAYTAGGAGSLAVVTMLLLTRLAFAEVNQAVSETLKGQVLEQTYWRDIRGTKTPLNTFTWEGNSYRSETESAIFVDDGKARIAYYKKENEVYLDSPSQSRPKPPSLKLLLDPRWKWSKSATVYDGIKVTRYKGEGTFRDSGKDHSYESSVYVESGGKGRIVAYEVWRENHTYADFWRYRYPKAGSVKFTIDYPKDAKVYDVRGVRARFESAVKAGKTGILLAAMSGHGDVVVVERGVPQPDDTRPGRVLMDGDDLGTSATYALGKSETMFGSLGKGIWLHFMPGSRGRAIPASADFTVKSYLSTKSGPVAAPVRQYKNVRIERIGSVLGFVGKYSKAR